MPTVPLFLKTVIPDPHHSSVDICCPLLPLHFAHYFFISSLTMPISPLTSGEDHAFTHTLVKCKRK